MSNPNGVVIVKEGIVPKAVQERAEPYHHYRCAVCGCEWKQPIGSKMDLVTVVHYGDVYMLGYWCPNRTKGCYGKVEVTAGSERDCHS